MDKVHIIVNPAAGSGRTEKSWQSIKEAIKKAFREFRYVFTEKPRQATSIARQLLKDGYDLIIGVGGDGTLNEICNGYFEKEDTPINNEAAIALIPSGTGSDFFRSQKIPRDFLKSIHRISSRIKRKVDIGKIRFLQTEEVRYFINVADYGLGAEVISSLNQKNINPQKKNRLTYLAALLKKVFSYKPQSLKIEFENQQSLQINAKTLIAAIANGSTFGGGMIIAPQARIDDGVLNLILIKELNLIKILTNIPLLYNGKILSAPEVCEIQFKKAFFYPQPDSWLELDGEIASASPFSVEILPAALLLRI